MTRQLKTPYLIMAGGTGGHIFPAMAVANALKESGAQVNWLGTKGSMEASIVSATDIPLHFIRIKGFRGKGLLSKLIAPFKLCLAIVSAMLVIKRIGAEVVIGFGGYVAAPGGIAAWLLRKKLIIHEQNSVAGSTNKLLASLAVNRLEAFPNSLEGAQCVGNPVRAQITDLFHQTRVFGKEREPKKLLIIGGSLGALAINNIVPQVVSTLAENQRPQVWHQTGKDKLDAVQADYASYGLEARVEPFIDDMAEAYKWADVVICRAGALTVSEIAVAGLPAIFIPYPHAIDNHQYHNAQWLVKQEAAYCIEQQYLNVDTLSTQLTSLLSDDAALHELSEKLKKLAMPDATHVVARCCESVCDPKVALEESDHAA